MKVFQYKLSEVKFNDFSLFGYSAAGEETAIIVPELDATFDIGKCPREALTVNHVLLTHGHIDHAAGLPYYFAQHYFQSKKIGTALVPQEIVEPLEQIMDLWQKIDGDIHPRNIIGMKPGDQFEINKRLLVRAFATNHNVPSLGYSIIEVRHKLSQKFYGKCNEDLLKLKSDGIQLTTTEETPLIAYLGDTALADFSTLPHVANAKVLVLECTFFAEDHFDRSRAYKHTHVKDLPIFLKNMNNEHIIISHVTKRIKVQDAKKILADTLDANTLQKIRFLME